MVMDLVLLDRILQEEVVGPLDGKAPEPRRRRRSPTAHPADLRGARGARDLPRVTARLPAGVVLERVRILEDPTLYADCTGIP